jgi:Gpi18-like mannosyltransferase
MQMAKVQSARQWMRSSEMNPK